MRGRLSVSSTTDEERNGFDTLVSALAGEFAGIVRRMVEVGSILFNRYEINAERQSATFAKTEKRRLSAYRATDRLTQEPVEVKLFPIPNDPTLALFASALWDREVRIAHLATSSPHGSGLLRLIDARKDAELSSLVIVSESTSQSLAEALASRPYPTFLRPEGRPILWSAFLTLSEALRALHAAGLMHRSICTDSVRVSDTPDQPLLRLGDFSWSVYLHGLNRMLTDASRGVAASGSAEQSRYLAPEALPGAKRRGESFASDLFSLGVVIAECLAGKLPSRDCTDAEWFERVVGAVANSPIVRENETRLLQRLMDSDPAKRPSADEVVDRIRAILRDAGGGAPVSQTGPLTIVFDLRPQSKVWTELSTWINTDGLGARQASFIEEEFRGTTVYVRKDRPERLGTLWGRGSSGTPYEFSPYKDKRAGRENDAIAAVWPIPYIPAVEDDPVLILDSGVKGTAYGWQPPAGPSWSPYFAFARRGIAPPALRSPREQFMARLRLTLDAERELLSHSIYRYRVTRPVEFEGTYRLLEIEADLQAPDPEFDTRVRPSLESWYRAQFSEAAPEVELSEASRPEAKMLASRRWRIREVLGENRLLLESPRSGDAAPPEGWIRPWTLRFLLPLLDRKRRAVDQIELDDYLLSAITAPGSVTIFHGVKRDEGLVREILGVRPLFLLQGPPGTGKTYWASRVIEALLKEDETARILVSAQAHKPLDHLMDRAELALSGMGFEPPPVLLRLSPKEDRIADREARRSNDIEEVTRRILERAASWQPTIGAWDALSEEWRNLVRVQVEDPSPAWERLLQGSANVIFVTSTSAGLRGLERTAPFDFVIIEEAGKAYAPELLPAMRLGRRWLLIGDQQQLPPFQHHEMLAAARRRLERDVDQRSLDDVARASFAQSLDAELRFFGHLFQRAREEPYPFKPNTADAPARRLSEQWRMPMVLSEFISTIFYHDRFVVRTPSKPLPFSNPSFLRANPLVWISTPHCAGQNRRAAERIASGGGYTNPYEVGTIHALLGAVGPGPLARGRTVAVLSPYLAQVDSLRRQLSRKYPNLPAFDSSRDVHTVDSFQGREADVVIVSLVRNNDREQPLSALGFLTLEERMNVLLSRASSQLIIVGCLEQLEHFSSSPEVGQLGKIPDFVRKHGEVVASGSLVSDARR